VISSDHWKKHPLETGDFQTEDVWICEKLQRGIASPAYEHGPLAKGAGAEEPIEWFHHTLRQYLVHDL
jgi:choline monooxygenase